MNKAVKNYNTTTDFKFIAIDIYTGEKILFTLKDVIFNDSLRNRLSEEMQYKLKKQSKCLNKSTSSNLSTVC